LTVRAARALLSATLATELGRHEAINSHDREGLDHRVVRRGCTAPWPGSWSPAATPAVQSGCRRMGCEAVGNCSKPHARLNAVVELGSMGAVAGAILGTLIGAVVPTATPLYSQPLAPELKRSVSNKTSG